MKKLESSGWGRAGKKNCLMSGKWSFIAVMSRYRPFSAPAVGTSIGLSDAVSSLVSTRWSSRISRTSCLESPAGVHDTKRLCEDTRTQLLRDSTHSGGRRRNSCFRLLAKWCSSKSADLESLEIVSAFLAESIRFSADGRLPHIEGTCSTILAWMKGFAGRLAAIEVSGAVPTLTPCSSGPAILGMHAASRRPSGPAQHEARTLFGAGAGSSRIRFLGKPFRAVPSKAVVPPRRPLDLAEVLAKLEAVLDKPRSAHSLE